MATIGDPLMDLGRPSATGSRPTDPEPLRRFLAGPTAIPGSLTRRELVHHYREAAGREAPDLLFYYVYGLFKIAVIAQQIYVRYVRGATRDPRFAVLGGRGRGARANRPGGPSIAAVSEAPVSAPGDSGRRSIRGRRRRRQIGDQVAQAESPSAPARPGGMIEVALGRISWIWSRRTVAARALVSVTLISSGPSARTTPESTWPSLVATVYVV